jgi:fido (protein-threonine AMPylation protein)
VTDTLFEADDEANTPLAPAEREGLIPSYITTRAELNEAEQENITEAHRWAFGHRRADVLSVDFLPRLHGRMLGRVWRWAGRFRTTERNIGIASHLIETELHNLVGG